MPGGGLAAVKPRREAGGNAATDASLVARVLAGDRHAYSEIVRRYQDELYRYAQGMGLDADTASDMVQDTLVRGYMRLRDCHDHGRVGYWLIRILRNRCLDHLKNIRRKEVPLDALRADDPWSGRHDRPVETRLALAEAFASLPAILRDAFLLKHQAGYSYDEMAGIAGCSVSAMKMRVHRAREELRACLLEQGFDGR